MSGSIVGSDASGTALREVGASGSEAELIRQRLAWLGDEKAALEARLAELEVKGPATPKDRNRRVR